MARISFVVVGKTLYQTTVYILRSLRRCKNQTVKSSQNKLQNKTINLLSYIFSTHTHILYPWVSILSISHFLETNIREQQKYEKRTQKYVDNTVNGLRHEIKFEIRVKNMIIIIQLPRHFFAEADTKKRRYASAKASAFADCRGEFRTLQLALT